MKTSIIIASYNRPKMLEACLRALALSSVRPDEIVVSDDGSGEEAAAEMRAFFRGFCMPIQYVQQEHRGFRAAAARNNGIRRSTGDYLIMLDCDILVLPDAMAVHLANARPGSFLAANRAYLDEASSRTAMTGLLSADTMENLWQRADKRHLRGAARQFERNILLRKLRLASRHKPKILGCHFSLFREDIHRINGFDENYVGWGLEDDDLSLRLHKAGVAGKSIILEARAMHLQHEPAESRPPEHADIRSMDYFRRPDIPAFCERGLVNNAIP